MPKGIPGRAECKADGCDRLNHSHGWCSMHHYRVSKHGDPHNPGAVVYGPAPLRFWRHVAITPGCWLWLAHLTEDGYGRFSDENHRQVYAHRWSYETLVGSVDDGLELDHLCRVRNCVNPSHLEPVTKRENMIRGESFAAVNARKTHCDYGHEFTPDNLAPDTKGRRICRECARRRNREYRERQKQEAGR